MQNLIEKTTRHKKDDDENGEEKKKRPLIKSATDLQRLKLEKLMKNPDKPVMIPESPREKDYMQTVPSFVRNVMGSSAGAGSGEFHVYRHLRRKEYARQKCIHAKSKREQLDDEYQSKLEKNRLEADAKTAKKRAKRLKKKQRAKKPKIHQSNDSEKQSETDDDDDEDGNEETKSQKKNEDDDSAEEEVNDNDDVDISQDTAGPAPKDEINNTPNKKEPIVNTPLNTDQEKSDNPKTDKNETQTGEAKDHTETEDLIDDQDQKKQTVDVTEQPIEESIKEPKEHTQTEDVFDDQQK